MAHIERHDSKAEMQGGSADDEIGEVDADSLAHLLAVDASGEPRYFPV